MQDAPQPVTPPVPPVTPNDTNQKFTTLKTLSLIFGIISIVTCAIPLVGIGLAIASLVLILRARRIARSQVIQPQPRLGSGIAVSVVGLVLSASLFIFWIGTVVVGLSTWLPILTKSINSQNNYQSYVAVINNAPKNFTTNQTIEYGPYDLSNTTVQKEYTPTAQEQTDIQAKLRYKSDLERYGYSTISDASAGYLRIDTTLTYNATRAEQYSHLSTSLPGWGSGLAQADIAGNQCVWTNPSQSDLEKGSTYDYPKAAHFTQPVSLSYICRVDKTASAPQLTLKVDIYTAVSAIVGTEGAPTKLYTYTINLSE